MVTSLATADIRSIRLDKNNKEEVVQIVKVRGGAQYEVIGIISFGINAIFGQFEAINNLEELLNK